MPERRLWAVRGATTLAADTREEVMTRTRALLGELFERNAIASDDVVSILFTATDDIRSEFPAAAAREMGLNGVPLMCARELDVRSDLAVERCIRVLVHHYGTVRPAPVYLEGAAGLLQRITDG